MQTILTARDAKDAKKTMRLNVNCIVPRRCWRPWRLLLWGPIIGGVIATATHGHGEEDSRTSASRGGKPLASIRNVIIMIGDGMGPQEVGLLTQYAKLAANSTVPDRTTAIEHVLNEGVVSIVRNQPHGALVTDSAAAATQLATGHYAGSEMVGANYLGESVENIVEVAHRVGKSAGLVTDTRMTHATPAGFAAHQANRESENEIAVDMLDERIDVLLGGGIRNWVPEAINDRESTAYAALMHLTGGAYPATSRRHDNRNLLLEARGDYALAFDRRALARVSRGRVLGLFADSELADALEDRATLDDPKRTEPTHVEMTAKALELLNQNPAGFFLMVEGGQIDWAGHNNDAGVLLHEMLQFDDAVRVAYEWTKGRDDTLLLVTADHETGSFGFSYAGRPLPAPSRLEGKLFRDVPFAPNFNYAPPELLDQIHAQSKSYFTMLYEFDALPAEQRTPERLVEIVNGASAFKITVEDAKQVLTRAPNRNFVEGHPYMNTPTVPRIRDFEAFYVYGENLRMNLLGRAVAEEQSVTWGAGTHSSTPVIMGAYGPPEVTRLFGGMPHATDVGRRMIEVISAEESEQR
ncbi:MAG: alkaline phosphatase [Pirellulales bacterium]|nr:alkaline phosphatase [Pirellulales bacterium]